MPRRATVEKRKIFPDPVYNSRLVTKFINNVTKDGKKTVLVYYDPDQPKHAVIRKDIPIWFPLGVLLVTGFLLVGSVMSFITAKKKRRMIERNLKK